MKYFTNASFEPGSRDSLIADAETGGSVRKRKFPVTTTIPSNEETNNKRRRQKTSDEEPTTVPELLHMMQSALGEVRGQLQDGKVKMNAMRAQLDNEKLKTNEMCGQLENQKVKMHEVRGQLEDEKDKTNEMRGQMEHEKLKTNEMCGQLENQKVQMNAMRAQLDNEKVKTNEMRGQLDNQKVKMNVMREQIETIEGDVCDIKEDMGEVKDGMGEFKNDMVKIKDDLGEPDHLPDVLLRAKGTRALWIAFTLSFVVQASQGLLAFTLLQNDATMSMDVLNNLVDDGLLLWHPENMSDFNNSRDINFLKAIRTESIALTEKGWQTSVFNMAIGITLLLLFLVQEVTDVVFTKEYHALDDTLTDLQVDLERAVLAMQLAVPCWVAFVCLGSIITSSLDTAATVQAAIDAFFILEMDDKLVPVMWQIMRLTDSARTTLEGREDGVTFAQSLYLGEDRHSHRRWRDAAQRDLLVLPMTTSLIVWMFSRWGAPLLAPASQHPYLKAFGDIYVVLPAAIVMAALIAYYVAFILGIFGYQWVPALHANFFSLPLESCIMIICTWTTSPFTDPSKGLTAFCEGSDGFFDAMSPSKDDIMALIDGRNPVLAVSAVMLCIVSLVWPPSCGSRWLWASAWLTLAVTLSPFSWIGTGDTLM